MDNNTQFNTLVAYNERTQAIEISYIPVDADPTDYLPDPTIGDNNPYWHVVEDAWAVETMVDPMPRYRNDDSETPEVEQE